MYLGGFAKVGGIEAFARDFLLAMAETYPDRELVMWGKRDNGNRLLKDIADSGAQISRSPWCWGCRWNPRSERLRESIASGRAGLE